MKPARAPELLPLCLSVLLLAGCGSGHERNDATNKANSAVPVDNSKSKNDLDEVVGQLNDLSRLKNADEINHRYKSLKPKSRTLDDSLAVVQTDSLAAINAGHDQIEQWHKQSDTFTDPDLRSASNKRQESLRQAIDSLSASNASLKTLSDSYTTQEDQTLAALDLDPSKSGLDSVEPSISKLIAAAPGLKDALSDVEKRSDSVNKVINQ